MPASTASPAPPSSLPWYADTLGWWQWLRARPSRLAFTGGLLATLTVFYGFVPLFTKHTLTVFGWAASAWNKETNYEHAWFIPPIALFLLWNAQPKLRAVRPGSSPWGLTLVGAGILLYLAGARTLQPRVALAGLPFLLLGLVLYLWGPRAARVLLFPAVFLWFMIPLPGLEQATVQLQILATKGAAALCGLIGLHLRSVGTTLQAADESFRFEIAGGCSGINSLMAITMLTAIFVHLTQDRLWKKAVLFALAAVFAVLANVIRLSAIMIVARFFGQKFAGGAFHDVSAFIISLPIAFGAMWLASKAVNWRPTPEQRDRWLRPGVSRAPTSTPAAAARPSSAYDY